MALQPEVQDQGCIKQAEPAVDLLCRPAVPGSAALRVP